jgi:hypothetical protein
MSLEKSRRVRGKPFRKKFDPKNLKLKRSVRGTVTVKTYQGYS